MEGIKAIIFDLEGVIINTEETVWHKVDKEFLDRRNKTYDKKYISLVMGTSPLKGATIFKKYFHIEEPIQSIIKERTTIAKQLLKKEVTFMPGFKKFYESVKNNYIIAVATAMQKEFFTIVDERMKISSLFENHVYHIEDVDNKSKPAPDVFLLAAKKIGIEPSQCVIIEDSPLGIEAGKRAGMKTIGITHSLNKSYFTEANIVVDCFEEIKL